jgi:hypothetical protein
MNTTKENPNVSILLTDMSFKHITFRNWFVLESETDGTLQQEEKRAEIKQVKNII